MIEPPVCDSLGFAIAWPDVPLETAHARRLLPQQVAFSDATENPKRLAALLEGLRRGEPALLKIGSHDCLHERYRLPAIVGAREALECARAAGAHMAVVSGSGSGLFAICARGEEARVASAMLRGFEGQGARGECAAASIVRTPPRVEAI